MSHFLNFYFTHFEEAKGKTLFGLRNKRWLKVYSNGRTATWIRFHRSTPEAQVSYISNSSTRLKESFCSLDIVLIHLRSGDQHPCRSTCWRARASPVPCSSFTHNKEMLVYCSLCRHTQLQRRQKTRVSLPSHFPLPCKTGKAGVTWWCPQITGLKTASDSIICPANCLEISVWGWPLPRKSTLTTRRAGFSAAWHRFRSLRRNYDEISRFFPHKLPSDSYLM